MLFLLDIGSGTPMSDTTDSLLMSSWSSLRHVATDMTHKGPYGDLKPPMYLGSIPCMSADICMKLLSPSSP